MKIGPEPAKGRVHADILAKVTGSFRFGVGRPFAVYTKAVRSELAFHPGPDVHFSAGGRLRPQAQDRHAGLDLALRIDQMVIPYKVPSDFDLSIIIDGRLDGILFIRVIRTDIAVRCCVDVEE